MTEMTAADKLNQVRQAAERLVAHLGLAVPIGPVVETVGTDASLDVGLANVTVLAERAAVPTAYGLHPVVVRKFVITAVHAVPAGRDPADADINVEGEVLTPEEAANLALAVHVHLTGERFFEAEAWAGRATEWRREQGLEG